MNTLKLNEKITAKGVAEQLTCIDKSDPFDYNPKLKTKNILNKAQIEIANSFYQCNVLNPYPDYSSLGGDGIAMVYYPEGM